MELENGISIPSFRYVVRIQILGTRSRFDPFKSFYGRSAVIGNYSCIKVEIWFESQPGQSKI